MNPNISSHLSGRRVRFETGHALLPSVSYIDLPHMSPSSILCAPSLLIHPPTPLPQVPLHPS
jgi:hypothetical protein